jgi:hypothetical protein
VTFASWYTPKAETLLHSSEDALISPVQLNTKLKKESRCFIVLATMVRSLLKMEAYFKVRLRTRYPKLKSSSETVKFGRRASSLEAMREQPTISKASTEGRCASWLFTICFDLILDPALAVCDGVGELLSRKNRYGDSGFHIQFYPAWHQCLDARGC